MLERIKPTGSLVNEILDHYPEEVWTSDSTTFFDPAIGGGQFVAEIESRLQSRGHSKENIRKRVFGFESSQFLIDLAVNMNKLTGQYAKKPYPNFLDMEVGKMKFDVVLGNPPYESATEDGRKDQANNLWSKFTHKGMSLVKDGGYMTFITPTSWLSPAADIGKGKHGTRFFEAYFQKYKTHVLNVNECAKHFNVGSTFSYFVLEKTPATNFNTRVITEEDDFTIDLKTITYLPKSMNPLSISINKKVLESGLDKFGIVGNNLPETRGEMKREAGHAGFTEPCYNTPAKGGTYWYAQQPIPTAHKAKVIISISGNYVPVYDPGGQSFTGMCLAYYLRAGDDMASIRTYLESRLVKFVLNENKYTGWVSPVISDLPRVDTTRAWTDQELYTHFGLTQEEVDYIESK